MRRRLLVIAGSITSLSLAEGLPVVLDPAARSVGLVGPSLALVVLPGEFGDRNLVILGPTGEELERLGTTCGTGVIDQVIEVDGAIHAIEVTPRGDFRARFDEADLALERVSEWR